MQVVAGKLHTLDGPQGQRTSEAVQEPIFPHHVAAKGGRDHRGMAGERLGGQVVVAIDAVLARIQPAFIPARITGPMQHESIVMGRIRPGNPLGVGAFHVPRHSAVIAGNRLGHAEMVGLAAVEPTDELIVAAFGNLRGGAAQIVADPSKLSTPRRPRRHPIEEPPIGRPEIERADARPDVDKIRRGADAVTHQLQVATDERLHLVGPETIRLGVASLIEPARPGRSGASKTDVPLVGKPIGIRIVIDVVIVRRKRNPDLFARLGRSGFASRRECPAWGWAEDIRQAIVIAPSLPVVEHDHANRSAHNERPAEDRRHGGDRSHPRDRRRSGPRRCDSTGGMQIVDLRQIFTPSQTLSAGMKLNSDECARARIVPSCRADFQTIRRHVATFDHREGSGKSRPTNDVDNWCPSKSSESGSGSRRTWPRRRRPGGRSRSRGRRQGLPDRRRAKAVAAGRFPRELRPQHAAFQIKPADEVKRPHGCRTVSKLAAVEQGSSTTPKRSGGQGRMSAAGRVRGPQSPGKKLPRTRTKPIAASSRPVARPKANVVSRAPAGKVPNNRPPLGSAAERAAAGGRAGNQPRLGPVGYVPTGVEAGPGCDSNCSRTAGRRSRQVGLTRLPGLRGDVTLEEHRAQRARRGIDRRDANAEGHAVAVSLRLHGIGKRSRKGRVGGSHRGNSATIVPTKPTCHGGCMMIALCGWPPAVASPA